MPLTRAASLALVVVAALAACAAPPQEDAADREASVWVSQVRSGGRQCDPAETYAPPDTRGVLEAAGVEVLETTEREQPVCMSCDCAAYSAVHYARIEPRHLEAAADAGFEPSDPPPAGPEAGSDVGSGAGSDAGSDVGDAADRVAFRGLGQEPGWMLEILPGEHIHFEYDYAQREVFTPVPEPEVEGGRTVWHAVTEAHDLRVVVEDTPCSDVMSGRAFEATVTITLDGETYRGCGTWTGPGGNP